MEGNSSLSLNASDATFSNVTSHPPDGVLGSKGGLTLNVMSAAKVTLIIKCTVLLAVAAIGAFGNTLTFFAIRTTPSLWTKSNMLIGNQVVANAYICGIQLPLFIVIQLYVYVFSQQPCSYQHLVAVIFAITKMGPHVCMFNLIPVAVDRYIAIVHPFFYEARVTETTIKIFIFAAWFYSVLVVAAFFVWFKYIDWSSCTVPYSVRMNAAFDTVVYLSVSVTMVFVYGTILRIAMAQRRKVRAVERWQDSVADKVTRDPQSRRVNFGEGEQARETSQRQRREFKAAWLTAALLFSVIVMWMPHHIARLLQASGNTQVYTQNLQDIGLALGLVNASTDWIIYGVMNTQFRNAFTRILRIKIDQRDAT